MAGYGAFASSRRPIDCDDGLADSGVFVRGSWFGPGDHSFRGHPRRFDSAGRADLECDLPAEDVTAFELTPAVRAEVDFGACFAWPVKLYRVAALAAGFRPLLSEAERCVEPGREPERAVVPLTEFLDEPFGPDLKPETGRVFPPAPGLPEVLVPKPFPDPFPVPLPVRPATPEPGRAVFEPLGVLLEPSAAGRPTQLEFVRLAPFVPFDPLAWWDPLALTPSPAP